MAGDSTGMIVVLGLGMMVLFACLASSAFVALYEPARNKFKELLGIADDPPPAPVGDALPAGDAPLAGDAPPAGEAPPVPQTTRDPCWGRTDCPNQTGTSWLCPSPWDGGYQARKYGTGKATPRCCVSSSNKYGDGQCRAALPMKRRTDDQGERIVGNIRKELDDFYRGKIRGTIKLDKCPGGLRTKEMTDPDHNTDKGMAVFEFQKVSGGPRFKGCVSRDTGYISCFDASGKKVSCSS